MLPFVFEDGFGFENYVEYVLSVPMYFIYRNGKYIDASGRSFRDFLNGNLDILPGEKPTINDWIDHVSTIFSEVRLKQFLEMRGADSGPVESISALSAFWVGILYDESSLDAAWEIVKKFSVIDLIHLRKKVPYTALSTMCDNKKLQYYVKDLVKISYQGLKNRNILDKYGNNETYFLEGIDDIAKSGRTFAEEILDKYQNNWNKSIDNLFDLYSYNIK